MSKAINDYICYTAALALVVTCAICGTIALTELDSKRQAREQLKKTERCERQLKEYHEELAAAKEALKQAK